MFPKYLNFGNISKKCIRVSGPINYLNKRNETLCNQIFAWTIYIISIYTFWKFAIAISCVQAKALNSARRCLNWCVSSGVIIERVSMKDIMISGSDVHVIYHCMFRSVHHSYRNKALPNSLSLLINNNCRSWYKLLV